MILTNAHIVLENEVIHGSVTIRDGQIESIDQGTVTLPGMLDCEGGYLLPGIVELHTDNMEKHFTPRPGVAWPGLSAFKVHDAQMISAGITTVFDAISVGDVVEGSERLRDRKSTRLNSSHITISYAVFCLKKKKEKKKKKKKDNT